MSWVALERAVRIARQRGLPANLVRWMAARDAIYGRPTRAGYQAFTHLALISAAHNLDRRLG